jgi:signal transduction histidine kinase
VEQQAREGNVTIDLELPQDLPALWADKRKCKQIALNLLSNAVKFTPPGGTVTVRASRNAASELVIALADTGIGIADADIPKAFAPFGQIEDAFKAKLKGTGLGLPLTKSLVELHGGTLDLESEIGVGTTVTVRFPAERTIAPSESARA